LALLQPAPSPNNLVSIPGPVYVEASQLQHAVLGVSPVAVAPVAVPATIDAVVHENVIKPNPFNPYAPTVESVPVVRQIPVQAQKRFLLLDEDVRVKVKSISDLFRTFFFAQEGETINSGRKVEGIE
jgi:hypothetical protein